MSHHSALICRRSAIILERRLFTAVSSRSQLRSISTHSKNNYNILYKNNNTRVQHQHQHQQQQQQQQKRWGHHGVEKMPIDVPLPVQMDDGIDIANEIKLCRAELDTLTDERLREPMEVHIGIMEKIEHARQTGDTLHFEGKEAVMCVLMQTVRKHDELPIDVRLTPTMHFMKDLGLDSLDLAEVRHFFFLFVRKKKILYFIIYIFTMSV